MELAKTEAKFFGLATLPLVEVPHHPSGGARAGEHRADAEGAVDLVNQRLTLSEDSTTARPPGILCMLNPDFLPPSNGGRLGSGKSESAPSQEIEH